MTTLLSPLIGLAGLFLLTLAADQAKRARFYKLGRDLELGAVLLGCAGLALVGWALVLAP